MTIAGFKRKGRLATAVDNAIDDLATSGNLTQFALALTDIVDVKIKCQSHRCQFDDYLREAMETRKEELILRQDEAIK